MRVYGAWIKRYCVLCSKTANRTVCYNFPPVRDKPLEAPSFVKYTYHMRHVLFCFMINIWNHVDSLWNFQRFLFSCCSPWRMKKITGWPRLTLVAVIRVPTRLELWLDLAGKISHWSRVTHIFVSKLTIIGSDNGLLPDRRQVIVFTNDGILLIGSLEINFKKVLIEIDIYIFIQENAFGKCRQEISSHFVPASMC